MIKLTAASAVLFLNLTAATARAAPSDVTPVTLAAQRLTTSHLPKADGQDEAFAARGFVATRSDPAIYAKDGRIVWRLDAFDFLEAPAPASVNPSLWRHAGLMARHGLFQVAPRIWQVRGFDLANMTVVQGDKGWIVIDTLGSIETARAARDVVFQHLGTRPISAVIYTHPHADHFGGSGAIVTPGDAASGKVLVIAPQGFLASAIGENVIAGPAMQRRATFQFGLGLQVGPEGPISAGIGPGLAAGTTSLIPPNRLIAPTGETLLIDGVRMIFQFTSGTEAPVEMNIDFPDWNIVDMAENANATQHNLLTPRGAQVRSAKSWADALTEAIDRFGDSDVLMTSHGWPRFGKTYIRAYLGKQRDYYAFVHDQTVRLMNSGLTGDDIASQLKLPPSLEEEWYDRPYYGSVSFNSRAVYQYYMGWYDADPVHLASFSRADEGKRYVQALGGAKRVRELAEDAFKVGDYAWAAKLLHHAVFADRGDRDARTLLARCYRQLAYQTENALWRNMYSTAAFELEAGPIHFSGSPAATLAMNLPAPALFDLLAVRLNGDRASNERLSLSISFTDTHEDTRITIENGVLIHKKMSAPQPADATLTGPKSVIVSMLLGLTSPTLLAAGAPVHAQGNPEVVKRFIGLLDVPQPDFSIVTP